MTLNCQCVIEALKRLGISYVVRDDNSDLIEVSLSGKNYFFSKFATPLNTETMAQIAKDKYFTCCILKDVVRMPHTVSFLDPYVSEKYTQYVKHKTGEEVAQQISTSFSFPCIVKRNAGSFANNVFECTHEGEVLSALQTIWKHDSKHYDYIALAQEKISVQKEYRAVFVNNTLELLYEKKGCVRVGESEELFMRMKKFFAPVSLRIPLGWAGCDVALTPHNEFVLFELNSHPWFVEWASVHGTEEIIRLYTIAIQSLLLSNPLCMRSV